MKSHALPSCLMELPGLPMELLVVAVFDGVAVAGWKTNVNLLRNCSHQHRSPHDHPYVMEEGRNLVVVAEDRLATKTSHKMYPSLKLLNVLNITVYISYLMIMITHLRKHFILFSLLLDYRFNLMSTIINPGRHFC